MTGRILDESGVPASQPEAEKPKEPVAVIPLSESIVKIEDGPLKITVRLDFDKVSLGGPEAEQFKKVIEAVLARNASLSIRLVELMLLGGQKRKHVAPFVIGAMEDVKLIRGGIEGLMARVSQGLDPMPSVEVAHAKPRLVKP